LNGLLLADAKQPLSLAIPVVMMLLSAASSKVPSARS
jgi:hypothetical protein